MSDIEIETAGTEDAKQIAALVFVTLSKRIQNTGSSRSRNGISVRRDGRARDGMKGLIDLVSGDARRCLKTPHFVDSNAFIGDAGVQIFQNVTSQVFRRGVQLLVERR